MSAHSDHKRITRSQSIETTVAAGVASPPASLRRTSSFRPSQDSPLEADTIFFHAPSDEASSPLTQSVLQGNVPEHPIVLDVQHPLTTVGPGPTTESLPHFPPFAGAPTHYQEDPYPAYVRSLFAHLEIQWIKTCKELKEVAARASDTTLTETDVTWAREHCRWLQTKETGLRANLDRLALWLLVPQDPNILAYNRAVQAYHDTIRAYWANRRP